MKYVSFEFVPIYTLVQQFWQNFDENNDFDLELFKECSSLFFVLKNVFGHNKKASYTQKAFNFVNANKRKTQFEKWRREKWINLWIDRLIRKVGCEKTFWIQTTSKESSVP